MKLYFCPILYQFDATPDFEESIFIFLIQQISICIIIKTSTSKNYKTNNSNTIYFPLVMSGILFLRTKKDGDPTLYHD